MSKFMRISLAAMSALLLVSGCASERPPRSFVQPNIVKKSDLDGTYYYLQTITDAPPTNGSTFVGLSSSLMKIRFDVQEDYIYARRAYEQMYNSEPEYQKDPANYKGQPLAAWKISKQFDVIRDYNSTTGEQTNKIIESEERPWNEREYIRVDWSQNLVTDYVGIGIDFFFSDGAIQIEPVSYWESDPTSPDGMHIERAQNDSNEDGFAKGEMTYLDLTNQLIVTPDNLTLCFEENGKQDCFTYPKCFFPNEEDDCASQKVKVRHAFAKIGPTHDYIPRKWDGTQMNLFGVWDVDLRHFSYDRLYGNVNSSFVRYAARFNVWMDSCLKGTSCDATYDAKSKLWNYYVDGQAVLDADGNVSHDPADDPRRPVADRVQRTIPYYASGSQVVNYQGSDVYPDGYVDMIFPPELFDQFVEVVRQWNDASKPAINIMYTQAGATKEIKDVFVPCHNPVRLDLDAPECKSNLAPDLDTNGDVVLDKMGNPIYHVRAGDPRHSQVFWVHQPQAGGPLGYGPPMYDPQTGETISGQAYIYGGALDTYTARSRDLVLVQAGQLNLNDYTDGANVAAWVKQQQLNGGQLSGRGIEPKPTYSTQEIQAMANAMDFKWANTFKASNGYPALDTSSGTAIRKSANARLEAMGQNYFNQFPNTREQRLSRVIGTPLERMMITPELMGASSVSPAKTWTQLSSIEKAMVSPLRRKMVEERAEQERIRAEMVGVDFAGFNDAGIGQRVALYKKKYGNNLLANSENIRQDMRADIFLGVTLHEVGHNMGARHNFRASYDALNYFPEYWQLRTEAVNHPNAGMEPADGQLHARYINRAGGAITKWEIDNYEREYQYSSIMDYGAEFNSDLRGLGTYDKAFMKFSLAESLEVFTDAKTDADSLEKIGSLHAFQTAYGFPSPLGPTEGLSAISYQTYPTLFNSGAEGIYKRADAPYAEVKSRSLASGGTIMTDKLNRPMVPYYFCSDEFVGNLTCQRFDSGADAFEQAADLISRYNNFYVANNFKRDRYTFHSSLGYIGRIQNRYFEMLREQMTWYVLLRSNFQDYLTVNAWLQNPPPDSVSIANAENKFFWDEYGWGNFTLGVTLGFQMLGRVLTTPTAGTFFKMTTAEGLNFWKQFQDEIPTQSYSNAKGVGYIDGKYIDTTWNFDACGYYWADECQMRIGYMVDKMIALDVMTQSQAYFTGRDTSVDVREYAIGYILPFKAQIEQKFGSLFANDVMDLGPTFQAIPGGEQVVPTEWVFIDPTQTAKKNDVIDPSAGFTVGLYAGLYGMASFPTTFDHDFVDTTKIFVVGNGEASTPDAEIEASAAKKSCELLSHYELCAPNEAVYLTITADGSCVAGPICTGGKFSLQTASGVSLENVAIPSDGVYTRYADMGQRINFGVGTYKMGDDFLVAEDGTVTIVTYHVGTGEITALPDTALVTITTQGGRGIATFDWSETGITTVTGTLIPFNGVITPPAGSRITQEMLFGDGTYMVGDSFAIDAYGTITANPANTGTAESFQKSMAHGKEWYVAKDPTTGKKYAAHATPPRSVWVLDPSIPPPGGSDPAYPYSYKTAPLRTDQGVRMIESLKSIGDILQATRNKLDGMTPADPNYTKFSAQVDILDTDYNKFRENVEVMRSLQNAFGYGPYRTDAPFFY